MKNNFFKYIFFLVIICLLVYCIYNFYNENNQTEKKEEEEIAQKETTIVNDIRIGVSNFDNMNPILSNNKNVQDISRLIYEPLINITRRL